MFEFVEITAQYSNAVLVAVMPYLTDFAQKLNLPLQTPVTPAMVQHFKCDARRGHVGGLITLTNLSQFTFLDGRVCIYRSPRSFYSCQDPGRISEFYGTVKIKQQAALRIARGTIKKMGYTERIFHAETAPKITPPEKIGYHVVPRYLFQWLDPNWQGSKTVMPALLTVEVNASDGQIEMVTICNNQTQRPGPKVDVEPPLRDGANRSALRADEGRPTAPVSKAFADAFLVAILPQVSEFILKAGLSIPTPLTTNQVDMSQVFCSTYRGQPLAQVYLSNGDRFNYEHGYVHAFYAHDVFYQVQKVGRVEDFLGRKNMATNAAIALARSTLERLGYTGKSPRLGFGAPIFVGTDKFTRYFVHFHRPEDNSWIAAFEIDLGDKAIKSIYIDDPSLYRDPPEVSLPVEPKMSDHAEPPAYPQPHAPSGGNKLARPPAPPPGTP